jgi:hypothetical protein
MDLMKLCKNLRTSRVSEIFVGNFSGDSMMWISVRDVDACRMMSEYMVEMVNDGMQGISVGIPWSGFLSVMLMVAR